MPHVPCHLSEIGQPETISLTINNRNHKSIEKLPNQIYFSQSIDIIQLSVGQKVESDHASISFVTEQHSHPTANTAVEIFICQPNFISVWDGIKEILVFLRLIHKSVTPHRYIKDTQSHFSPKKSAL